MIGKTPTNPKQPLSRLLVETITVAREHGGNLVRWPVWRGCWTYPDCPVMVTKRKIGGSISLPEWWVTDNTVRTLIRRDIVRVTHVRWKPGGVARPAVVEIRRAA
jgi:hypothetical protein